MSNLLGAIASNEAQVKNLNQVIVKQPELENSLNDSAFTLERIKQGESDDIAKSVLDTYPGYVTRAVSDKLISETGKKYSDEEVEKAQKDYDNLSPEEQEKTRKAYENGLKEYEKIKTQEAISYYIGMEQTSIDKFLEEHPEYAESFAIMGPIAQDWNGNIKEAANEYYENAPLLEKTQIMLTGTSDGLKKALEEDEFCYRAMWKLQNTDIALSENKTLDNYFGAWKDEDMILEKFSVEARRKTMELRGKDEILGEKKGKPVLL